MMGCTMISGLYSCSESINDTLPSIGLTNKDISFNVKTSSDVNNNSKTRAAMMSTDGFENPHTLQGFSKTLYLHPLVETLQTQEHAVKTRGAIIDAASNMSSFGVTGIYYNNAGELPTLAPNYFHNIETVKSSDNIWTMREKRAWPTSKYKMAIYAYHPYGASEIAISDESQIGSPSVSYTVGSNPTTMSDFMTASATELNVSTATNNTVPLVFNHNLTAINFVVGKDMIPGTIKSVTFRNIYNQGKFTLGGAWSFTNYSLSDKSYTDLGVAITGAENEAIINGTRTLMMIPQTFSAENQTLEIVFNDGQTDYTLTTTLNGSSWVAGKTVTYKISSSAVTTLNLGTISFATGWDQISKTTWADGDKVGLYVKDQNGNLKSSNVKLTYDGTKWTAPTGTKLLYSPQYDYYVYYPYTEAGVANTSSSAKTRGSITAGDAAGFFASGIAAWSPKTDQSTLANINASDLQTAKGLISTVDASSINFTMAHAMGLAEIKLGTKDVPTTRTFDGNTNTIIQDVGTKSVTAAANFNGGVVPYHNGDYYAVIKPKTATTFKSASGVANGWVSNAVSLTATASGAIASGTAYSDSTYIYLARAYSYTGSVQQFVAPKGGIYKLEVWGAQPSSDSGKGGYSYGTIRLSAQTQLYVVAGGYIYNGGGKEGPTGPGGGGATHIATTNRGELKNYKSYQSEILIVAGGGGGRDDGGTLGAGYGGGLVGGNGDSGKYFGSYLTSLAYGGTQTSPGANANHIDNSVINNFADFGQGGSGYVTYSNGTDWGGAGGGGWYGGGGSPNIGAGGGGSGHIGTGVTGATIAGNQSFISPSGGTEIGHTGDGYARITQISF